MTVFVLISNKLRRATFTEKLSRVLNAKTGNEEQAQGELILLAKYGELQVDDEVVIDNVTYRVISRENLPEAPWYRVYSIVRLMRGERVY